MYLLHARVRGQGETLVPLEVPKMQRVRERRSGISYLT